MNTNKTTAAWIYLSKRPHLLGIQDISGWYLKYTMAEYFLIFIIKDTHFSRINTNLYFPSPTAVLQANPFWGMEEC